MTATRDPWDLWLPNDYPEPVPDLGVVDARLATSPVADEDFFSRLADQVDPQEVHWQHDPVRWAKERCDIELWSRQRQIAESVRDRPRTAVPSCHNTGKSLSAAVITCWWIDSHAPGDAFVVTTAPTGAQVKAILWRNINHVHATSGLPGRTNLVEWYIGQEMVAMGRKPSEYDEAAFQGIHALHVLVVIDEACHDDETDVLTRDGWKHFRDVTMSDEFLTMDPATGVAEHRRPTRVIHRWHNGDMLEYSPQKDGNFCVTPNHEMWVRGSDARGWYKRRADQLPAASAVGASRRLNWDTPDMSEVIIDEDLTGIRMKSLKVGNGEPLRLDPDLWMEFLGWYLSEGSVGEYGVTITQTDPGVLCEIEQLCRKLGFDPHVYGNNVRITSIQLARHLARFGKYQHERFVPPYAKQVSSRQIRLLLDAYERGDGYVKGQAVSVIYTSSRRMADDLQELILKTGVHSSSGKRHDLGVQSTLSDGRVITTKHPGYFVVRTRDGYGRDFQIRPNALNRVCYSGYVHCATVPPHHLLFTRRRGRCMWSGNCGVGEDIWIAAETIASNDLSRILAIGNPDDPHSQFAEVCRPGSGWNVIEIGFKDTPNSTGEPVSERVRQSLISRTWADARKRGWGESSPLYISKVEGRFPEDASDGVIAGSWVAACRRIDGAFHGDTPRCGGLDVGAGGDETVLYARRGRQVFNRWGRRTKDPMELVGNVVRLINDWELDTVTVDVVGVGWGVYGRLRELSRRMNPQGSEVDHDALVVPFNSAETAFNDQKFINKRAELWWDVGREYSRLESWDLTSIDDDTAAELVAPKYKLTSRGKIQIESKAEVRKRIGRSTDNADALLMAFLENTRVGTVTGGMQRSARLPG